MHAKQTGLTIRQIMIMMVAETNTTATPFPNGPIGLDRRESFTYPHNNSGWGRGETIHFALKAEATYCPPSTVPELGCGMYELRR